MHTGDSSSAPVPGSSSWGRRVVGLLSFLALVSVLGCSSGSAGAAKTRLSGKVTKGGQAVSGNLFFVGATGKEVGPVLIATDGSYTVANLPAGHIKVLVKGMSATMGGLRDVKLAASKKGPGGLANDPPFKYATAAGGLTVEIADGDNRKDFELTP
jgi:hypothetical protein